MRPLSYLELAALSLALCAPALAAEPQPRSPPIVDHRELKLYKREIADDRKDLERLLSRLDRLDALRAMRAVDGRAVEELDRKVHDEMLREAREQKLAAHPTLGHAARVSSDAPLAGERAVRFFTAADAARVDQITVEWAALRGKVARSDLEARRTLLAELIELARVELVDDLRAFKEKGGDLATLPGPPVEARALPAR